MDFYPSTYITQYELNQRANSLAYLLFKQKKREEAKKFAKRKILLIMTIVKCLSFKNKLKKLVIQRRKERARLEEEAK